MLVKREMLRKGGSNWVEGDRFFDREIELEALEERVRDGTHTLITAQRRRKLGPEGRCDLCASLAATAVGRRCGEFDELPIFVDLLLRGDTNRITPAG